MRINHDCETIYNGVYLNSYLMLTFYAVAFKIIQLTFEECVFPFFNVHEPRYDGTNDGGDLEMVERRHDNRSAAVDVEQGQGSDVDSDRGDQQPGEAKDPASCEKITAIEIVTEAETERSGTYVGIATTDGDDPDTTSFSAVSSAPRSDSGTVKVPLPWQRGFTPNIGFLCVQSVLALCTIGVGLASIDPTRRSWNQYEDLYGFLTNSGAGTLLIGCCVKVAPRLLLVDRSLSALLRSDAGPSLVLLPVLGLVFLPMLCTHVFFGLAAYSWVILLISLILLAVGLSFHFLRYHARRMGFVLMSVHQDQVIFKHFLDVCLLVLFTWCLQTSMNYMTLIYAHRDVVGFEAYFQVIVDEYDLRTQTYCLFHRYTDNVRNFVLFWGWV